MESTQALDLLGGLHPRVYARLAARGRPARASDFRPGLWLGRNGGMPALLKRFVREVVRRDYFAKLVFGTWGVNVRVAQGSDHALVTRREEGGGPRTDLPFRVTEGGLEYGLHVLGYERPPARTVLFRDAFVVVSLGDLVAEAPEEELRRVGVHPGDAAGEGEVLVGYILPFGARAMKTSPFGMLWSREATRAEERSARDYLAGARVLDTSCGPIPDERDDAGGAGVTQSGGSS